MKPSLGSRIKLAIQTLRPPNVKNTMGHQAARQFLKYGNGSTAMPNWSQVIMSDEDTYTGIMQGAINVRAVTVASLATNNLKTEASTKLMDAARAKREEITHPYLDLIDTSKSFSNYKFWYDNSVYLDLEGLAYIMAIRTVSGSGMVGNVQSFKLLNPYRVQRVFDSATGELLGYKEYQAGMSRDIPKEMIIPIANLNPFSQEPFSMVDAAKDHQFTLKTASDYTRSAIANNINAPGIIATDRELEGEELENFKKRVTDHNRGEPIFGGGAGSVTWQDMQADLNKTALTDVNNISLQNIVAVSGVSKTMFGWEESGTTRDTAMVQKDNFIELRAMNQLQLIIDALNQDYKNYYDMQYKMDEYRIVIENPLATDIDEETQKIANRQSDFELYTTLINKGYDEDIAARYSQGEMTLEELGKPKNPPVEIPIPSTPSETPPPKEEPKQEAKLDKDQYLQQAESGLLSTTQASLQNSIINIDNRLLAAVTNHIGQHRNDFTTEGDVVTAKERNALQNELEVALAAFYGIILPLYAYNVLSKRLETYKKAAQFKMNNDVRAFIHEVAGKASESHISTLLDSMMKQAQKDALAGVPRPEIAKNILNRFGGEIANSRAIAIARTESNRAFTMSQFQADKQFIKQGGFEGKAYKQWVTRSANPCPFCQSLAAEPPIPFDVPFAEVGDELTATAKIDGKTVVKKMTIGFMDCEAGNAHTNCNCEYELIIKE